MSYPSDITREQFEIIRPILESARKKTRPRTLDLYDIFNALLYVITTGCQWRALPHDYPKWKTVHRYFITWSEVRNGTSVLDEVLKKIGKKRTYEQWKKTMHEHGYC
ncbi:MAG: hypothetical protein CR972_05285 [Candidatus Moraniibacteriota bacterium]|nr:MAG: hypothetical protein CR972_05285 [Candidatus Moranbacteria bacterium]